TWEARNAGSVSRSFAIDWLWRFSLEMISFALGVALFFIIFKFLPSRRIVWRTALVAAVFCSLGFEVAKRLYALYVTQFATLDRVASDDVSVPVVGRVIDPQQEQEHRRPVPVPVVGLLHGLLVPPGRRSGRDVRSGPHAALTAGAVGLAAGWWRLVEVGEGWGRSPTPTILLSWGHEHRPPASADPCSPV